MRTEPKIKDAVQSFNFTAHLYRQREWSEKTFGPGDRAKGVVDHIRKELAEIENDPKDITEWIDVAILALDGAWRAGATPEEIIAALTAKQAKNEAREWPDWRTAPADRAIEHDRTEDAVPVPQPEYLTEQELLSITKGQKPHRIDGWKREWLGDRERPILYGERTQKGDAYVEGDEWFTIIGAVSETREIHRHCRTKRPLPAVEVAAAEESNPAGHDWNAYDVMPPEQRGLYDQFCGMHSLAVAETVALWMKSVDCSQAAHDKITGAEIIPEPEKEGEEQTADEPFVTKEEVGGLFGMPLTNHRLQSFIIEVNARHADKVRLLREEVEVVRRALKSHQKERAELLQHGTEMAERCREVELKADGRYRNYLAVADAICRESSGPEDLRRKAHSIREERDSLRREVEQLKAKPADEVRKRALHLLEALQEVKAA